MSYQFYILLSFLVSLVALMFILAALEPDLKETMQILGICMAISSVLIMLIYYGQERRKKDDDNNESVTRLLDTEVSILCHLMFLSFIS